ncbi:MAG: phosphoribosylformylglycinamidine synthase subunit PurQ [Thermoplasmatales archaeon]
MEEGVQMKDRVNVGIITMEGTNNEMEAYLSFMHSGANPEIIHIKKFESGRRKVSDFDILFFPGGFSAGDYVRAGAIMAARIKSSFADQIYRFEEDGRLIMGSCNGFQVLIEIGLLPNTSGGHEIEAALATNISNRFEARTVFLKISKSNCIFLRKFGDSEIIKLPVAHAEGRFIPASNDVLRGIQKARMNVITYVDNNGEPAGYPWNPNGSVLNIGGLCNKQGNVIGLMPHPERVFHMYTESDWTRYSYHEGVGSLFFKSAVEYVREKF